MNAYFILFAGWLVPGLGHLIQKKYVRAVIFFLCIVSMFLLGLTMEGKFFKSKIENLLGLLAFFSDLGNGILYIIFSVTGTGEGNPRAVTFDYGTAYIAGSGLLNYLVALNAYDIARGKKK